jgi:hypothetical protein
VWLWAPCEWEKGNMASVSPHLHAPCSCCIDHNCCPPSPPHFRALVVNQLSSFKCRWVSWQAWYFSTQCTWSHRTGHSSNRTPACLWAWNSTGKFALWALTLLGKFTDLLKFLEPRQQLMIRVI